MLFIARAGDPCNAIERRQLDVRGELETVREFYEAQAEEHGITITCAGQAGLDADPLLLRRAIGNLLANALAHTPHGGRIDLAVREADSDGLVEITVRDTGCGIRAEDLPRIFDRYYRSERERLHRQEGAGLGLAIVKSILELHGGSVFIESREDKGTTIVLKFPTHRERVEDAAPAAARAVRSEPESLLSG